MNAPSAWTPLLRELDRWHAAERCAALWLRDDDAVEPSPALERLLDLSSRFDVPFVLAIIPEQTGEALARRLLHEHRAIPAVHGWSHANHAPLPEKKQELGSHRPRETVLRELTMALARMNGLYDECLLPMLVPPWNRIDPDLLPRLPALGYRLLSGFGSAAPAAPLTIVNTHVDLIDWRGTRRCRDFEVLAQELAQELSRRFDGNGEPTGILSHHLVHDDRAWAFLEALFSLVQAHPACRWANPRTFVQA